MSVMNHSVAPLTPEELYPVEHARAAALLVAAPPVVKVESPLPCCPACRGPARGPSYAPLCEDCWVARFARCRDASSYLSRENRGI